MSHADVKIIDTCQFGGKAGKVLHGQPFPEIDPSGELWYWVVIPEVHPSTGYWYRASCLEVVRGQLPIVDLKNTYRHRIEKDGNVAYFKIDKSTKQVLISEGYSVTYVP